LVWWILNVHRFFKDLTTVIFCFNICSC
jgi:hypothetical protein